LFDRLQRKNFLSLPVSGMLVGMSVAGILQYVYYFIFYLDIHLALLCAPLIFVMALWMSIVRQNISIPPALRISLTASLLISLIAGMVMTSQGFYEKFSASLFYSALIKRDVKLSNPYHINPSNKSVEFLVSLIQKYTASEQEIAIFVTPDDQVEALLLTDKTDLLGMTEAEMSAFSPTYSALVIQRAKATTELPLYIFYATGKKDLIPLQQEAYQILSKKARYVIIDQKRDIVVMKKMTP